MNDEGYEIDMATLEKEHLTRIKKVMKEQDEAIARFPNLYHHLKHWECGPGWHPLLIELSGKLEGMIERDESTECFPRASQVKEKFGLLRFYMFQETRLMRDLISEYEKRSSFICEECGTEGTLQFHRNWWMTRCEDCLKP